MVDILSMLQPWYSSLEAPEEAQAKTLETLLKGYRKTEFGCRLKDVATPEEFKTFPVSTFKDISPFVEHVIQGKWNVLLPEPPIRWGMTRGSTGTSKVVPFTLTDMEQKSVCGPRATLNYVYQTNRYDILDGYVLNTNFPSRVGTMQMGDKEIEYGYSSGIYAEYAAEKGNLSFKPTPAQINDIGAGTTPKDWEERFSFIYKETKDANITMAVGVTQGMIHFGSFLKKKYGIYPRHLWKHPLLVCTSLVGINTKERPVLKAMYDFVDLREMYGATEGIYAQQRDERPLVFPNYDYYFFEVETRRGTKMLYELKKGERGSVIVSSCLFPRYRIGDIVKSFGGNAFTCLGREKDFNVVKYHYERMLGQTL